MDEIIPEDFPRLYTELAGWFHLLTSPGDYAEEAEIYRQAILSASDRVPRTMLELGSGGGNNASHLKKYFELTLVDISADMLAVSQQLNPECEHVLGDMRTVRLERLFDVVFVHDAIMYMQTKLDLSRVIESANLHCRPGGLILLAPDHVKENFKPSTSQGGHDGPDRALRYLDWSWDPDPGDTTYTSDMVYMLKNTREEITVIHDRHVMGLFPRQKWLDLLTSYDLQPQVIPFEHSQIDPGSIEFFLARKINP